MTVIVTRNVPARFRGFLASVMLEAAPGVYVNPSLSAAVRGRVWGVLTGWFSGVHEASLVLLWTDSGRPCGMGLEVLGEPPREFVDFDGVVLSRLRECNSEFFTITD